jgi:hypothetical protein
MSRAARICACPRVEPVGDIRVAGHPNLSGLHRHSPVRRFEKAYGSILATSPVTAPLLLALGRRVIAPLRRHDESLFFQRTDNL